MKVETVLIYHKGYKIGVIFCHHNGYNNNENFDLSQVLVGRTVMIYNAL